MRISDWSSDVCSSDLTDRNIAVNAVLPGFFPTSMTAHLRDDEGTPKGVIEGHIPLRRLGRPDDIAGIIVFLASRAGAYVMGRSEEGSVGKECVSTCRFQWSPYN